MIAIGEIKKEFATLPEGRLQDLIDTYSDDERQGVKTILLTAEKRLEKFKVEQKRTHKMYEYERQFATKGFSLIGGIDEVGRGPLAGPVLTCCLILPKDYQIFYLNDSKKLSAAKRDELYEVLIKEALCYSIGTADEKEIDEINILQATYKAMRDAIDSMKIMPDQLLCDAVTIPGVKIPQLGIIKGDAKSASIAAASIVAKVTRDRLMEEYDKKYPEYGFASNKGYGTKEHIDAIKKYGPCPIHRKSFITSFVG